MHWYLVHTKPKQEIRAKQNLEQQGYVCYLPLIHSEILRRGKISVAPAPLFPRYLFIQLGLDMTNKSWNPIRSTKGVNRLVVFGASPAKVDNQLVITLQRQERQMLEQPKTLYSTGEQVQLMGGAFAGLEGVYQMSDGDQRAIVLIELMSKPVTIRATPNSLRKIN